MDSNLPSGRIVTVDKLGFHVDRIVGYSNGTAVFPITLELDLTTACSRHCPGCATILRPSVPALDQSFIHNLLSFFSVNTRGLLLAGGEPTLAATFSTTLRSAKQLGFENIAVISNGAHLEDDRVIEALTTYATSVRISINNADPVEYGRSFGCDPSELKRILKALERLRYKVERDKSNLEIGVASLTQPNNAEELSALVGHARSSGAHWLYFHPYCSGWEIGEAAMVDQEAILGYLKNIMSSSSEDFPIILFEERYAKTPVSFTSYHAAFFLLMIGADKRIYLGAETKYQPRYEVFDLSDWRGENFLNNPNFRRNIHSFSSNNYRPLSSRGRGVLYSQIIDDVICGRLSELELASKGRNLNLKHVHIL
jgi:MoaA/NifB/PqqE/SkfB family radical SAM enzyme